MGSIFGKLSQISTFGESHGAGIGVVIDGCPAQLPISAEAIQAELDRRRPGQSDLSTPRKEGDRVDLLASIDINVYRNEKSVQLIVQDHKHSASFVEQKDLEKKRYEEIRAGAPFDLCENVIPDRNDFAKVYTLLRRLTRSGNDTMSLGNLLYMLSRESGEPINYIKLKFIVRIMHELTICGVEEIAHDIYHFTVAFTGTKTSIEKSNILKKLKSQCNKNN